MLKTTNSSTRRASIVIAGCLAFLSCSHQDNPETFIVPNETMPVQNKVDPDVPPPPPPNRTYYFPSNFIIDSSGKVFFYQEQTKLNDDVQVEWNQPPEFINLRTKDIVRVPENCIEEFISLNVLNRDSSKRYISIASAKDTIQSVGLERIIAMSKNPENHIRWKFRTITLEEKIVLDYKIRQAYYNSDDIHWDSTKIRNTLKR